MKNILTLITALVLLGCNERVVQLPETNDRSITEILDVSPAYIFYIEENDSVEFNRKNLISTTNWLVNVDKRLRLEQAMPHIKYLQDKRKKASMHKNEAARNFFSCSNPEIKNLAFVDFTDIEYLIDSSRPLDTIATNYGLVMRQKNKLDIIHPQGTKVSTDLSRLGEELKVLSKKHGDERLTLFLGFDPKLTFQDYIDCKSSLLELEKELAHVSQRELIYN